MQPMKKSLFYLFLALAICIVTGCTDNLQEEQELSHGKTHEVTQSEALKYLNKILPDLEIPSTRGASGKSIPEITSSYSIGSHSTTRSNGEIEPYFHIFNFGDNEGFAIMSGDDRTIPLLALTFKGELTPEIEIDNPGFKIAYAKMEDYYVEQVSTFSYGDNSGSGNMPINPGDDPDLELHFEYSDPVITYYNMPYGHCLVEWGQEEPYNKYCGLYQLGLEVYAGCVPVAVAQLMSIYKYPNSYNGHTFNWNLMNQFVNKYFCNEENHPVAVEQIAQLMGQLGLDENLDVDYEVIAPGNGSGASPRNIPRTLRNFGYSNGGVLRTYNTKEVTDELKAGYPVLIGGSDGDAGHRWLGHGIKELFQTVYTYNRLDILLTTTDFTVEYILCNFGWNGYQDGYYASKVFDTNRGPVNVEAESSTRSNTSGYYQYDITAVINIRK